MVRLKAFLAAPMQASALLVTEQKTAKAGSILPESYV